LMAAKRGMHGVRVIGQHVGKNTGPWHPRCRCHERMSHCTCGLLLLNHGASPSTGRGFGPTGLASAFHHE
jgi:hypothetical protein